MLIAGVPSSQALPGFLIPAPPSVGVPDVICVLAVWIPKKKIDVETGRSIRSGASGLPYYCAPLVCVSDVIELLAVWRHNKPKTKKDNAHV